MSLSLLARLMMLIAAVGSISPLHGDCPSGLTTIFFANGIWTTHDEAINSTSLLSTAVKARLNATGNHMDQSCLTFLPAYDSAFVDSNNVVINYGEVANQLITAIQQRELDFVSNFWGYVYNVTGIELPDWFVQTWETTVSTVASVSQPDLLAQETWYITAGTDGNHAVVVAHSQGNLYVNEVYPVVSLSASLKPIALASPAPHTVGSGPWFTLDNDIILTVSPGALSANLTNTPGCGTSLSDRWTCHSFDQSYISGNNGQRGLNLTGNNSGPTIEDAVISAIGLTPGAPTCTLFANPSSISLSQSSVLSWTTTGTPTSAVIDNSVGAVTPIASGSVTVTPTGSTTYTLTVTSSAGSGTCFTSIAVNQPPTAGFVMSAPGLPPATNGQTMISTVSVGSSISVA